MMQVEQKSTGGWFWILTAIATLSPPALCSLPRRSVFEQHKGCLRAGKRCGGAEKRGGHLSTRARVESLVWEGGFEIPHIKTQPPNICWLAAVWNDIVKLVVRGNSAFWGNTFVKLFFFIYTIVCFIVCRFVPLGRNIKGRQMFTSPIGGL